MLRRSFACALVEAGAGRETGQRGSAYAIRPVGPSWGVATAPGPDGCTADAVTSRYCRPPCSYMDGPPLVGPPSGSVASSPPVLVSYTCTLRSAAVANTRPVPVTMRPP